MFIVNGEPSHSTRESEITFPNSKSYSLRANAIPLPLSGLAAAAASHDGAHSRSLSTSQPQQRKQQKSYKTETNKNAVFRNKIRCGYSRNAWGSSSGCAYAAPSPLSRHIPAQCLRLSEDGDDPLAEAFTAANACVVFIVPYKMYVRFYIGFRGRHLTGTRAS